MEFAIQHTLSSKDIKLMRKRLGLKQKDFAALLNVSVKTVERWEEADVTVTGPAVTLLKILYETPEWVEELQIPTKIYPLRLFYYYKESLCTVIDVNEPSRKIAIKKFCKESYFFVHLVSIMLLHSEIMKNFLNQDAFHEAGIK